MFICQRTIYLPAIFSATFLATALFTTSARADWYGQIQLGDERPAGQTENNGFADSDGNICIGTSSNIRFHGNGQASIEIVDDSGDVLDQREFAGRDINIGIFSGYTGADGRNRLFFDTGVGAGLWWSDSSAPKWAGISLKMTGTFDCTSGCNGSQDGKLTVKLYTAQSGYCY
ncbi:hypothetical protein GCM10011352_00180 [Marinobacterium zhoushanense]|uniref:Uncharacterized protein n=1 Tax=Marinobacterium zhoushanense TaxID=1679163 RepID=A0ABQ1JUM2_9GAMM|nr:hypothetical protein [Marinobacterium zhoushanense]GGB78563.1 hypothetical protein GCM10011352_00180 [Marinobacterium zhoushanense]